MSARSRVTASRLFERIARGAGRYLGRGLWTLLAHTLCLYACLVMLVNSHWSDPIFNQLVNPKFSGEIRWERVAWGLKPWDISLKGVRLVDATGFEVIKSPRIEIRDYDFNGLLNDTHIAALINIHDGQVELHQRPHTQDPQRLVWNIAEMFQPHDIFQKLKDGKPKPPVLVQVGEVNLYHTAALVTMGTVRVEVRDASVLGGFFEIDLTRDIMRIRARDLSASAAQTEVRLRRVTPGMSKLEKSRAPIERTLFYPSTDVRGSSFWWLKDSFGSRELDAKLYQHDDLHLSDWVLDLAPLGVPHGRATARGGISALERYISPWGLDQWVRGELKFNGELNGPLSDPSTRKLSVEGQIFVPLMGGVRFRLDGHKRRDGLAEITQGRIWSMLGDLGLKATLNIPRRLGGVELTAHELIWSSVTPLPPAWRMWEKSATGRISLRLRPELNEDSLFATRESPRWMLGMDVNLNALGPKRVALKGRAELTARALSLHQSELTLHRPNDRRDAQPRQRITARGTLDFVNRSLDGKLRVSGAIGASSLPPLKLPISAQLTLDVRAQGSFTDPKVSGVLRARKITSRLGNYQRSFREFQGRFSYQSDELRFSKSLLKSRDGSARFELRLPLKRPQELSGWARLRSFVVDLDADLSPLKTEISGKFDGLVCTLGPHGCERYRAQVPKAARRVKGSCLESIYTQNLEGARGAEACLFIQRLKIGRSPLGELDLDASLRPDYLKVRRGRFKINEELYVELQGQLEDPWSARRRLSATLSFGAKLSLLRRFTERSPPALRSLSGDLRGDLTLSGPLDQLGGRGALKLWRLRTNLSDAPPLEVSQAASRDAQVAPLNLALGASELSFELSRREVTIHGHLGRQFWLNGAYQLSPAELNLSIDFPLLSVMMLSAPLNRAQSTEGELRALLRPLGAPFEGDDPERAHCEGSPATADLVTDASAYHAPLA